MDTPTKEKNSSPIDMEQALLRMGQDKGFLFELINIYRDDFPEKIQILKKSINGEDFKTIQETGHNLKGSSANLSLPSLVKASSDIECAGKDENIEEARKAFQMLTKEFERLNQFISKKLAD
jgi:HPt (histidine-containing phosphotransfer) domain-containing protein